MFFEDIGFEGSATEPYREDICRVIRQHVESFESNGWEVVPLGLKEAERHPKFCEYEKLDWLYALSSNPPAYTRICYMRWLAYASTGLPFADLDVINFGMTPADAQPFFQCEAPPIICRAHSVGLFSPAHYDKVLSAFDDAIRNFEQHRSKMDDVNDMTLLKAQCPGWVAGGRTFEPLAVRAYARRGWETATMVHFPHSTTPLPRSVTIQKVIETKRRQSGER